MQLPLSDQLKFYSFLFLSLNSHSFLGEFENFFFHLWTKAIVLIRRTWLFVAKVNCNTHSCYNTILEFLYIYHHQIFTMYRNKNIITIKPLPFFIWFPWNEKNEFSNLFILALIVNKNYDFSKFPIKKKMKNGYQNINVCFRQLFCYSKAFDSS